MSPGDDDRPDRPDRPERERRSWREIDRQRDGTGGRREPGPGSPADVARADRAAKQYVKQIDGLFSKTGRGADVDGLVRAMRDAHGTPGLAAACRAYRDAVGMPGDGPLLSLFLDCGDPELVLEGIEALRGGHAAGSLQVTGGQRTQLRTLALDSNDAVAEGAETLLEQL